MKKNQRRLLIIAVIAIVLYYFRGQIIGMFTGVTSKGGNGSNGGLGGGYGGGGGAASQAQDTSNIAGVQVGEDYFIPGATVATGYVSKFEGPQGGASTSVTLPANCVSGAFTQNGQDYCIALDSRGNEVTLML